MKRPVLPWLALLFGLTPIAGRPSADSTAIRRICLIYEQKLAMDTLWPGFSSPDFDVPVIYYTEDACYAANPAQQFKDRYGSKRIYSDSRIDLYKTARIDTVPFHMHASIVLGDSCADFRYRSPYLQCSSPETAGRYVPDLTEEQWYGMLLHECFHGFQYKHPEYLARFEASGAAWASQNELKRLYRENAWFHESVDRENGLLLSALAGDSTEKRTAEFVRLRQARYRRTLEELHIDLSQIEPVYETMEGTARYAEYFRDTSLYPLETERWLYDSAATTYFYATGFNIARLLDRLGVRYKPSLFEKGLSLLEMLSGRVPDPDE